MARSEPCAICGGNSGLFGYAIKDGFICPACLEKAGLQKAAFSNPAGNYSSSQLREMISVRERRIAAGPQAVSPDELLDKTTELIAIVNTSRLSKLK